MLLSQPLALISLSFASLMMYVPALGYLMRMVVAASFDFRVNFCLRGGVPL